MGEKKHTNNVHSWKKIGAHEWRARRINKKSTNGVQDRKYKEKTHGRRARQIGEEMHRWRCARTWLCLVPDWPPRESAGSSPAATSRRQPGFGTKKSLRRFPGTAGRAVTHWYEIPRFFVPHRDFLVSPRFFRISYQDFLECNQGVQARVFARILRVYHVIESLRSCLGS